MSLYSISDQELLNEIQYTLIETPDNGFSMTTSIWTIPELIQYLNDRQRQILRETGIVMKTSTLNASPEVNRYELPEDCITVRRVAWHSQSGVVKELIRTDPFALDNSASAWGLVLGTPQVYAENATPTQVIELAPAPQDAGYLHLVYIAVETDLSNTGIRCSIPDEFAFYLKYGVLADCWKKAGPGQDLIRAAYCEERFQEAIDLGRALMLHVGGSNV